MTKANFYKNYVKDYCKKEDKPFNRELWNDTADCLFKDNQITENQVNNWTHPNNKFFK